MSSDRSEKSGNPKDIDGVQWNACRGDYFGATILRSDWRWSGCSTFTITGRPASESLLVPWGGLANYTDANAKRFLFDDARGWARKVTVIDDARGWPMRSMWCRWRMMEFSRHYHQDGSPPYGGLRPRSNSPSVARKGPLRHDSISYGIPLGNLKGLPRKGELFVLPLAIWFPGFAINTLFYGTILWLLILGPFVLRRFVRLRRGRCPACGYDLRVSTGACPECGSPILASHNHPIKLTGQSSDVPALPKVG